jgi:hypothetical protein
LHCKKYLNWTELLQADNRWGTASSPFAQPSAQRVARQI